MGELQHGFYDDEHGGLMPEEISASYGLSESNELQDSNEDTDRSDEEQGNHEEGEADMELDEEGFGGILLHSIPQIQLCLCLCSRHSTDA